MVADVLAGEAAAWRGTERAAPLLSAPSAKAQGVPRPGPGSLPRRWARPQPGPRSGERGACALAAGVCGLWAAPWPSKEGRVAKLGGSLKMGH